MPNWKATFQVDMTKLSVKYAAQSPVSAYRIAQRKAEIVSKEFGINPIPILSVEEQ